MSKRKPWVTSESWRLAFSIACSIRNHRTEKEAIQGICAILHAWDVEINPWELGSRADYADALYAFYEAGGIPGEEPFEPF